MRASGIASGFELDANSLENETLISMYRATAMAGSGPFLLVTVNTAAGASGLPFEVSVEANEGLIPVALAPGVPPGGSQVAPAVGMVGE